MNEHKENCVSASTFGLYSVSKDELLVRSSLPCDSATMLMLNEKWQRNNLITRERGFLSGLISRPVLEDIIRLRLSVTLLDADNIVGYYLLNPWTAMSGAHEDVIFRKKEEGTIPISCRVGYSTQGLIDTAYQGRGLLNKMLHILFLQLDDRYDVVTTTIAVDNARSLRAHTKVGFKVIERTPFLYFVSRTVFVDDLN